MVIDKDGQRPGQDYADEDRKDKNDYPGSGFQELAGIEIVTTSKGLKSRADPDVPVDIKKQGRSQRYNGKDKHKNRVEKPRKFANHKLLLHK